MNGKWQEETKQTKERKKKRNTAGSVAAFVTPSLVTGRSKAWVATLTLRSQP